MLTVWNIVITIVSIATLGYLSTIIATGGMKKIFYEKRDEKE
jgi:hypothetical protein